MKEVSVNPGQLRPVMRVIRAIRTNEGTGFMVNRTMPQEALPHLDPFVLLDELGPDLPAGHTEGYDEHPHCGLEVLTYVAEGEMINSEPGGAHEVVCRDGGAVWMTFGDGAVHIERPSDEIVLNGGRCHGFQLWMALPSAAKKARPQARAYAQTDIPVAVVDDGRVTARVVAGEAFGKKGPAEPVNEVTYLHLAVAPGGSVDIDVPPGYTAFSFAIDGIAQAGGGPVVPKGSAVLFAPAVGPARLSVPDDADKPASLLFISGRPTNEPIIRRAVFVMNSEEELAGCFQRYGHYLGMPSGGAPGGPPA